MTIAVASLNILLGVVYTQYGTMTMVEMVRGWRHRGFSHFGAAWIAIAFTCGPHHLVHGIHAGFEGRAGGPLDLFAVMIGLPAGVTWFLLRVEAFAGGRGDRFISGTPLWVAGIPTVAGMYLTALVAGALSTGSIEGSNAWIAVPNVLLVAIYGTIGYYLLRTQLANRKPLGGWSVSGLALTVIFPSCALMHGIFGFYTLTGRYGFDIHGFTIDLLAVPAGLYFLWVVHGLYNGAFRDWNRAVRYPLPATASVSA